jgi:glycosyltransferase involved in cell wall biosynthesis
MSVSIIITNYNYAPFLREAIDSALRQQGVDVEVVVVDDGSTDGSVPIIESYADRVIPVYQANEGQSAAAGAGLARSSGDVVIFLDADDTLYPNAARLHAEQLRDAAVTRSSGYLDVCDGQLRPVGRMLPYRLCPSGDYREKYRLFGPTSCRPAFTSGIAWSRWFLEKVFPLPREAVIGIDGYLTATDLLFGPIAAVRSPVGCYRVHTSNKGPIGYRFDPKYLRNRVDRWEHRIAYSLEWARRLGMEVDPAEWRRRRNWTFTLAKRVLHLMDAHYEGPGYIEQVMAPLRSYAHIRAGQMSLSAALAVSRLLPARQELRVADYLLQSTWGKKQSLTRNASE